MKSEVLAPRRVTQLFFAVILSSLQVLLLAFASTEALLPEDRPAPRDCASLSFDLAGSHAQLQWQPLLSRSLAADALADCSRPGHQAVTQQCEWLKHTR